MVAGLEITSTERSGCCVVTVSGEVELSHARRLEVALIQHTGVDTPLVLDLTGVQFLDSAGLYVVLRTHHEFRQAGQRLITVPSQVVMRVFELAGVHHFLPTCPSVADALSVLSDAVAEAHLEPTPASEPGRSA